MKTTTTLLFCLFTTTVLANNWLDRFNITPHVEYQKETPNSISIEPYTFEEASVEDYNTAVDYNNEAVDAMKEKDYEKAISNYREAIKIAPAVVGFRRNYIAALNNSGKYPETLIEEAKILMGIDSDNANTAFSIGIAYLNQLKNFEKAAEYFNYALNKDPENTKYANALITAIENTDKYSNYSFELLEKYAEKINEAYPYYLLGQKYLEKKLYSKAMVTLSLAKALDSKGYAHHAFVRAAFYAGCMNGLKEVAEQTLKDYGEDKNLDGTKRIYNVLSDKIYSFLETIDLEINGASSMKNLTFEIRPMQSFSEHQNVELISTDFIVSGEKYPAEYEKNSDGTIKIIVPAEILKPEIKLEMLYRLKLKALSGVFFKEEDKPEIAYYKKDPKLCLNDARLENLANYVDNLTIPDEACSKKSEELFVTKAIMAVAKGLNYKENGIDNDVSWIFSNLDSCDCSEYSRLLTALCIKRNIPARLVSGFLIKSDNFNKPTKIGHQWCEAYIDGKGWMPLDPTLQSSLHSSHLGNLLNDQIFFEYYTHDRESMIGVKYLSSSPDVSVSLDNTHKVSYWNR